MFSVEAVAFLSPTSDSGGNPHNRTLKLWIKSNSQLVWSQFTSGALRESGLSTQQCTVKTGRFVFICGSHFIFLFFRFDHKAGYRSHVYSEVCAYLLVFDTNWLSWKDRQITIFHIARLQSEDIKVHIVMLCNLLILVLYSS